MGFQGSLNSVNLGDIFQTIAMNRQTGTLSVQKPDCIHNIWFLNGEIAICDQAVIDGRPGLLTILMHRGVISKQQADELSERAESGAQPIRELILASGDVTEQDLDLHCNSIIEEAICDIFEWNDGDFTFTDGDPTPELYNPNIAELGTIRMQTAGVVMEATRRSDEWARIRQVIHSDDELFVVDNEGRANLSKIESDPEILKVLRYLDGRHKLMTISISISLSRFDVFAIVSQLILQGIARTRSEQEIVADAIQMRSEGEIEKARTLLENAAQRSQLPDIIRPLAEVCADLQDIPRAVELYLDLIQNEQDDGNVEQALADLDTVISLSPDDPELQVDRAEMLFELGQNDAAAEAYLKAAESYIASRNTEEALTACHRAKDLNHLSPAPHRYLAKAYILERQTESALVEYKSLWHILLSSMRPKKALDKLTLILEQDCKIASLKESVISHAKGSDAVKTGSSLRMLVNLIIIIILGVGGWQGYEYYNKTVVLEGLKTDLKKVQTAYDRSKDNPQYGQLLNDASDILTSDSDLNNKISAFIDKIKKLQSQDAEKLVVSIQEAVKNRKFNDADSDIKILNSPRFNNTTSHTNNYEKLKELIDIGKAESEIRDPLEAAKADWADQEWDSAIAKLTVLTDNRTLPAHVHDMLKKNLATWLKQNRQSQALYNRALTIQKNKSLSLALTAFQRARVGEGVEYQDKSKTKIAEIEAALARNIDTEIDTAIQAGLNKHIYKLIQDLTQLSASSGSSTAKEILKKRRLPLTLTVDSQHTTVVVNENGNDTQHNAPANTKGPWTVTIDYPIIGHITIKASRRGFSDFSKIHKVNENDIDGLIKAQVILKRGPLWISQLEGKPIFTPQVTGNRILVATDNNNLCLVDNTGTYKKIRVDSGVNTFNGQPFVFKNTAYVVLGDTIHAIDLLNGATLWSYPNDDFSANRPGRFVHSPWVQEHELKTDHLQVFIGTAEGMLITLEIPRNQKPIAYPETILGSAATAAPLAYSYDITDPSVIYIPAGPKIIALDASAASDSDPLKVEFSIDSRGEISSRPTSALVEGKKAVIYADNTGNITAINADPASSAGEEAIGSWGVDNGSVFTPVIDDITHTGIIATSDGSVYAIDLNKSGAIKWRFPENGNIGTISGPATIGKQGVYVADSTGNLSCIDATTGKLKWKVDVLSAANTGVLYHQGLIYVGTKGKTLVCFEEALD